MLSSGRCTYSNTNGHFYSGADNNPASNDHAASHHVTYGRTNFATSDNYTTGSDCQLHPESSSLWFSRRNEHGSTTELGADQDANWRAQCIHPELHH
jgi:hypothetical protein